MPIRDWLFITAVGCLTAFPVLGQPQQQTGAPQTQAAEQHSPADAFPMAIPVEIIEDKAKADARQRGEAEAAQREIDDLVAQEGMNSATQEIQRLTERMATYAWYQTIAAYAGTFFLLATLLLSINANRASANAAEAANDANRIARDEQRPWVVIEREITCDFTDRGAGGTIFWNYDFINKGKSPAYDIYFTSKIIRRNDLFHMREELTDYVNSILGRRAHRNNAILFAGDRANYERYRASTSSRFDGNQAGEEQYIMLMACVTYRLSPGAEVWGYDARMFSVEPHKRFIGPFGHTILEFGSARVVG